MQQCRAAHAQGPFVCSEKKEGERESLEISKSWVFRTLPGIEDFEYKVFLFSSGISIINTI